ncbi:MAG: protein phosphatase CheZ [Burkholderiaceae bacterium]|jgi:chemotaxis protein CheZ|nr:protein phosphatase CheZ [Burkholderiaceae bacterium]
MNASSDAERRVVHPQVVAEITSHAFQQIGQLTRELHDALGEIGLMSRLQQAANDLPDARSRLDYIARKTGEAADKVLNSVDRAKLEHARIGESARRIADAIGADPVDAVASGAALDFVREVEEATGRVDAHLTDIMIAQDFHDLTGQVVSKVVALAGELEENLIRLLVQVAPAPAAPATGCERLSGPVVDAKRCAEVVSDQGEVDELLANLGF